MLFQIQNSYHTIQIGNWNETGNATEGDDNFSSWTLL